MCKTMIVKFNSKTSGGADLPLCKCTTVGGSHQLSLFRVLPAPTALKWKPGFTIPFYLESAQLCGVRGHMGPNLVLI